MSQKPTIKKIQLFLKNIKDYNVNGMQNVVEDLTEICKSFDDKSAIDILIECFTNYVNLVSIYSTRVGPRLIAQKTAASKYMNVLNILNSVSCLHDIIIKFALMVIDIVCDPSVTEPEFVRMELLRVFNNLARHATKNIGKDIGEFVTNFHICKLVDVLTVSSCYEYQLLIIEYLFLVCTERNLKELSYDMFPGKETLQQAIKTFDLNDFHHSSRTFLNMVNLVYDKVLSVIATEIFLDFVPIYGPVNDNFGRDSLWVDFNKYSMSVYFDRCALLPVEHKEDKHSWELITVFYDDINDFLFNDDNNQSILRLYLKNKSYVMTSSLLNWKHCNVISLEIHDRKEEISSKLSHRGHDVKNISHAACQI